MANLLHISEAASLAMHTACLLAATPQRASAEDVAERLHASRHHLAKVLQRLVKAGIVHSTRGPGGGFVLARNAGEITLLDVYEAIEGPVGPGECLLGLPSCIGKGCILGGLVNTVQQEARDRLAKTNLLQLAKSLR